MTGTYQTDHGLSTLGPELVELRTVLDDHFVRWATEIGAAQMLFPPLLRVADLDRFDYFRNFPHLAVAASRIDPAQLAAYATRPALTSLPSTDLAGAHYVLPSAACYNIYLHLQHTQLSAPRYITTIASCFRNEQEYVGLKRLWGFSMREIVCVGPRDAVAAHIGVFKTRISELTRRLGIPVEIQVAADPFFQPAGADAAQGKARAVAAQLFPTKEEFVHRGSVAIASVNFHRNFFGERCQIRTADEQFAFTGCVAFGVERWLQALLEVFRDDARAATAAIRALTPAETART